ncbi:MAG: acyltransferase [Lachnospiraceae bacterium]|nr:acyltransferase [Lachnospiraceae bacterium]
MKTNQKRLFYLDVIRVAAAILIVVYHFSLSIMLPGIFRSADILHATVNGSWGMTPVYCFFMVSGAALLHRYGDADQLDVKQFYKKRFFSIYPLFWIAYVIGFFAVYWQLGHLYDIPTWSLIWSVIGIDGWIVNWIPTFYMVGEWFLGSIIMLYLVFPLVRVCWKKNRNLTMAVSFLAAAALFWYHPFPMDIKQNPVVDLFYFLLGGWIEGIRAWLIDEAGEGRSSRKRTIAVLLWCLSLGVLAVWFFVPITDRLPAMEATVSAQAFGLGMFLRQSFILVCTCAFYVFLMEISRWLEQSRHWNRIILEISGKTYGIFLTHHMVSQLICRHFDGANSSRREVFMILILVFAATWVMTLAIYRIESYIKDKF